MIGRPRGTTKDTSSLTGRERAILRHYLVGTDYCAKEVGLAFGISERRVNQVVRQAMDEYRCGTRRELARLIERRMGRQAVPLPLW